MVFDRVGTVIFSVFVCLGQVIFAMGANLQSYNVMLAGRFVFGLVVSCDLKCLLCYIISSVLELVVKT